MNLELLGLGGGGALALRAVFGPAAGEVGEALRRWTEYRLKNVGRVVEAAASRLEDPDLPGAVAPRVAMRLLEEGSYAEDPLVIEYLGGVLASSRNPDGGGTRGASWLSVVARMSNEDVLVHYVLYGCLRRTCIEQDLQPPYTRLDRHRLLAFIPADVIFESMAYTNDFDRMYQNRIVDSLYWLEREGLVGEWSWGQGLAHSRWDLKTSLSRGLVFEPSAAGIQLFVWGQGRGEERRFLNEFDTFVDPMVDMPSLDVLLSSLELLRIHPAGG